MKRKCKSIPRRRFLPVSVLTWRRGLGEGFAREMRDVESTIRRETSNAVPEFRSGEGRDKRGGGTPSVEVVQNIYANETSYAEQQRQAARQFRQIAREVMA